MLIGVHQLKAAIEMLALCQCRESQELCKQFQTESSHVSIDVGIWQLCMSGWLPERPSEYRVQLVRTQITYCCTGLGATGWCPLWSHLNRTAYAGWSHRCRSERCEDKGGAGHQQSTLVSGVGDQQTCLINSCCGAVWMWKM